MLIGFTVMAVFIVAIIGTALTNPRYATEGGKGLVRRVGEHLKWPLTIGDLTWTEGIMGDRTVWAGARSRKAVGNNGYDALHWELRIPLKLPSDLLQSARSILEGGLRQATQLDSADQLVVDAKHRLIRLRSPSVNDNHLLRRAWDLARAASALDGSHDEPAHAVWFLASNADADPRRQRACLRWFAHHHPGSERTKALIEVGLRSKDGRFACLAARHHHDDDALHVLTDIVCDGSHPMRVRVEALDTLLTHRLFRSSPGEQEVLSNRLNALFATTSGPLMLRIVDVVHGSFGLRIPLWTLAERFRSVGNDERLALAEAIADHGADAETQLLEFVAGDYPTALRVALLKLLGQVGTATAVPELQELADASWLTNANVRGAARQAIGAIAERHAEVGAGSGGLMLADDQGAIQAGQLSEAEEAGALALEAEGV